MRLTGWQRKLYRRDVKGKVKPGAACQEEQHLEAMESPAAVCSTPRLAPAQTGEKKTRTMKEKTTLLKINKDV